MMGSSGEIAARLLRNIGAVSAIVMETVEGHWSFPFNEMVQGETVLLQNIGFFVMHRIRWEQSRYLRKCRDGPGGSLWPYVIWSFVCLDGTPWAVATMPYTQSYMPFGIAGKMVE